MVELSRRGLLTGLVSFAACAPAIVRASSLMPVKAVFDDFTTDNLIVRVTEIWPYHKLLDVGVATWRIVADQELPLFPYKALPEPIEVFFSYGN